MSVESAGRPRSAYVIVLGNEKGGSGKSTVGMHIAVALMKAGQRVATRRPERRSLRGADGYLVAAHVPTLVGFRVDLVVAGDGGVEREPRIETLTAVVVAAQIISKRIEHGDKRIGKRAGT